MAKKILIVTQHFWPENFRINDIVQGFLDEGLIVDVLCGLPNYPKGEWFDGYTSKGPMLETYHGANVYRVKEIPRKGNTSIRIFLNYISYPITASLALGRLSGGYDAILCYNTSPVLMSFPAILASRKFKAPLTNYVLDIWPENLYSVLDIKNKFLRNIASAVSDWHYKRADKLIAMSKGLENRLLERVGKNNAKKCLLTEKQYTVIPQYCEDFYAIPSCDETLKAENNGKFTLMFAGNFSPAQSLDTAILAMKHIKEVLREKYNNLPPIQLLLVGDGMSKTELVQLVNEHNLNDIVRFYGSVSPESIPALSGAVDALLVSLSDSPDLGLTVPAKLASCMAAAKPLLVSINGEGAISASASGGAFVSEAKNAEKLAENLCKLALLPLAERQKMGKLAFNYYETNYKRDKLLKELIEFIF